jgi:hypothetical protein
MLTFFTKKRKLRGIIFACKMEADTLLESKRAAFDAIRAQASKLRADGNPATAHECSARVRALLETHELLSKDLEHIAMLDAESLTLELQRFERHRAALRHFVPPDAVDFDPADEIILRIGIEGLAEEADHLVQELSERMSAEPKTRGTEHPSMIAGFRELRTQHLEIMRPKTLESFLALTKHYEVLQRYVAELRQFKSNLR